MIYGVTFGTKHSYRDFELILSSKEIGLPEPKTQTVSVFGRDGDIDLTDALGDCVTFENRKLTFTFSVLDGARNWPMVLSEISNYLHGQKMRIILDVDKGFYYWGRCKVNSYKSNKTLGIVVIECDVEPYKLDINGVSDRWKWDPFSFVDGIIYVNSITVDGRLTVNLPNRTRIVSPTFICSEAMSVTFNGVKYELRKGRNVVYGIRLQEGDNELTFEGNGTVQIDYRGGSL